MVLNSALVFFLCRPHGTTVLFSFSDSTEACDRTCFPVVFPARRPCLILTCLRLTHPAPHRPLPFPGLLRTVASYMSLIYPTARTVWWWGRGRGCILAPFVFLQIADKCLARRRFWCTWLVMYPFRTFPEFFGPRSFRVMSFQVTSDLPSKTLMTTHLQFFSDQ